MAQGLGARTNGLLYGVRVLALALSLTLLGTPEAAPSARLLANDELLSEADVQALDRELRVLNAQIQELKPHMPKGYVVGVALGFSFAVLLLPGIPLLILGAVSSFGVLLIGGVLTGLGGTALLAALICLVLGNNAESDLADERVRLVERRDALKKRLEPYQPGQRAPPTPVPGYVPGVQLDLPSPRLVTLALF